MSIRQYWERANPVINSMIEYRQQSFTAVAAEELEQAICDAFQIPSFDIRAYYQSYRDCSDRDTIQAILVQAVTPDRLADWYGNEDLDFFLNYMNAGKPVNRIKQKLFLEDLLCIMASHRLIPSGIYLISIP